jgi:hypothetical protein
LPGRPAENAVFASQSGCTDGRTAGKAAFIKTDGKMPKVSLLRLYCAVCCAIALGSSASAAVAQSGNLKPPEQKKPAGYTSKDGQKRIDEIAEAARVLTGTAGKPECVWLGRRVVILMWRDDLDTAFRHLDLYDRFSCPNSHIQAAFRCLIKQGPIDPKAQETLNSRAFSCWLHPDQAPQPAAAPATAKPAATSAPAPR